MGRTLEELKPEINYIYCPDKECELWFDTSRRTPCERQCPKENEMKKMVVCWKCETKNELPGRHISWCRIECCSCGAMMLRCGYNVYQRILK